MPFRNPEDKRAWDRKNKRKKRKADPNYARSANLRQRYKLTLEQWDAMLIEQAGRCAICGDPMPEPHVDHDHTSGVVRELLCGLCNSMIGKAREKTTILAAGMEYLNRHHPERPCI